MRLLSSGDTGLHIPWCSDPDEIGDMARAVRVFRDEAIEKASARERGRGAATKQPASAGTRARRQRRSAEEQTQVVKALKVGLGRLSMGDLTFRLTDDFPRAYQEIKEEFNLSITRLRETLQMLSESTREVSSASTEISASTTDLSQRAEEQAASLQRTSSSLEKVSVVVKKNAASAQQASVSAVSAREIADRNGQVVAKAVEAMDRIEEFLEQDIGYHRRDRRDRAADQSARAQCSSRGRSRG